MFCLDVFPLFVYLCGMERLHPDTTPEHKAALLLPYVSSHCVCSLALCISTLTFGQLRHRIVRLSSGVHTPSPGPSPPPAIKTTHISAPFSHLLCLGLWHGALYGMILTWTCDIFWLGAYISIAVNAHLPCIHIYLGMALAYQCCRFLNDSSIKPGRHVTAVDSIQPFFMSQTLNVRRCDLIQCGSGSHSRLGQDKYLRLNVLNNFHTGLTYCEFV